jgi:hypothetical protein
MYSKKDGKPHPTVPLMLEKSETTAVLWSSEMRAIIIIIIITVISLSTIMVYYYLIIHMGGLQDIWAARPSNGI